MEELLAVELGVAVRQVAEEVSYTLLHVHIYIKLMFICPSSLL